MKNQPNEIYLNLGNDQDALAEDFADLNQIEIGWSAEPIDKANLRYVRADARLNQTQGWRPIETAPKDGTTVLLLGYNKRHADGYWESKAYDGNGCWVWPYVKAEPRNWMPLPQPPQEKDK